MSPMVGRSRQIVRQDASGLSDARPLYAFNVQTGTSRSIPATGQRMPFPFVVWPGGEQAIGFNPGAGTSGLPNATFVSVDTSTGRVSAASAVGQHVPGLSSDNSLVLDAERGLVHGIFLNVRFEDPQSSTVIVMPDESGTVMKGEK